MTFSRRHAVLLGVVAAAGIATTAVAASDNFRTHLSASEETGEVVSDATGQANFQINDDGTEISYRLITANIENVTQAHIHLGPAGSNGAVVVWLYPAAPPAQLIEGRSDGVLATGVITAADLVGPLAGQPLSALLDAIAAGNAYVNVHTTAYGGGEIRGQLD